MKSLPDITREAVRRREDMIVALSREGCRVAEIAALLGITERTVTRARSRRGIARPSYPQLTDDEIARAKQLLDDGASVAEAARSIGRTDHAIHRALPGRGWTPQQVHQFIAETRRYRKVLAS